MFLLGLILMISSSFVWAFAVMMFRKGGKELSPFGLNLGKNAVGFIFLTVTIPVVGHSFMPDIPSDHLLLITLSGIVGMGLGDLLLMRAITLLGAGLNSIVSCLYTPLLMFSGFLFLGEPVSPGLIIGAIIVIVSIIMISVNKVDKHPEHLFLGIFVSALSVICTVAGILLIKDLLPLYSVYWIVWYRIVIGSIAVLVYILFYPDKKSVFRGLNKKHNLITIFWGGFFGAYLALVAWTKGLEYLPTTLVSVISQLNVILIVVLAYFYLKEPLTKRKIVAASLAVSGAVLAVLSS